MCTSLSIVGRQHWKRGKRWGGLTVAVVVAAVATKEDAQVVHTGEQRRQHRPREIMNENGRAANTTACYLAATAYGFLSLSLSFGYRPTTSLSRSLQRASHTKAAVFCPRSGKGDSLLPTCPSSSLADCRAQRRARVVCTTV